MDTTGSVDKQGSKEDPRITAVQAAAHSPSKDANPEGNRDANADAKNHANDDAKATEAAELRELMVRYQQADPQAVEQLVARLSPRLLRFLAGNLNTRGEAEDLLQICWMQVHRSRHTYRPSEPVLPWIFAIARHVRLDAYRRRQRLDSREVLSEALPDRGTPPDAERGLMEKQFFDVLDHLPDSQREVVHMLKVTGMSLEEVALATSSTVGAVKQKAHRAYEKLRGILARPGSEPQATD